MEGEYLVEMRQAMEKLAAGKIDKKQYNEVKKSFLNELFDTAKERVFK